MVFHWRPEAPAAHGADPRGGIPARCLSSAPPEDPGVGGAQAPPRPPPGQPRPGGPLARSPVAKGRVSLQGLSLAPGAQPRASGRRETGEVLTHAVLCVTGEDCRRLCVTCRGLRQNTPASSVTLRQQSEVPVRFRGSLAPVLLRPLFPNHAGRSNIPRSSICKIDFHQFLVKA